MVYAIEAWTRMGLTRFLVLFLIDQWSRRVEIDGVTPLNHRARATRPHGRGRSL